MKFDYLCLFYIFYLHIFKYAEVVLRHVYLKKIYQTSN